MRHLQKNSWMKTRIAVWFVAALSLGAGLVHAQGGTGTTTPPIVGGRPFLEVWVDPCNGQDNPASAFVATFGNGTPDQPFQTIGRAITALSPWVGPNGQGLVHANPGVYSASTNGEFLPIIMRDFIHLQGVDARRVVIRGDQTQTPFFLFEPVVPFGNRFVHEALVDLSFLTDSQTEEMVDGFTFQGGHVQIYAETEVSPIRARISNSVFDMLNFSDVGVAGPLFGILMVHTYDLAIHGYNDIQLNILNNTFIQAWATSDPALGLVTSVPGSVAITDVANTLANDPLFPSAVPDPNPILRGLGNPNIQNNLIRAAPNPARTALLGIDSSDTTAAVATVTGASNAFDPAQALATNGVFNSQILGAVPVPAVNTNPASGGFDAAFVGELLPSFGVPPEATRDWRVLFDSAMVDAGTSPTPANLPGGALRAVNGTGYLDPIQQPLSSFDFDGEVYGNPRRVGGETDIGFDETDLYVDSLYGNDSRTYSSTPCAAACSPTPGLGIRLLLFPTPGTVSFFTTRSRLPYPGPFPTSGGYHWAFSTQFGTVVPPRVLGSGISWMQTTSDPFTRFSAGASNVSLFPINGYIPPLGNSTHNFSQLLLQVVPPRSCTYVNEQLLYRPLGGSSPILTNLQSAID